MKPIVLLKRAVFLAALVPAALLVRDALTGGLTANPIDYITDTTGRWAIRLLMASLCVTPLRRVTGWNDLIKLRRMVGLLAFFYAALHVLTWVVLDWFFDFRRMAEDVVERPFITLGMATLLMLLALAVTSTTASIRRLGRRWQQLHRLVYVAGVTALLHFWLVGKVDVTEVLVWAAVLPVLLGVRVWWALKRRTSTLTPSRGVTA